MKKAFLAAGVALLSVAAVWSVAADDAGATPSDKLMICHATASASNPYTSPDVNTSSIDEENNQYLNGHGDHQNDIIPPFTSPSGTVFPGLNWDEDGQAIWNNGCVVPPEEPPVVVEVQVVAPTMTDPDCDAPGQIVLPERDGLDYTETVGTDHVTVTVSATEGFVLPADATTSWTFAREDLAQLDPADPRCVVPQPPTPPTTPPTPPAADVPPQVDVRGPVPPVEVQASVTAAPAVDAVPTALPVTGSSNWLIVLIGLATTSTGLGLVAASRRTV
jgi:LPXTG-motif cell wall-anchored protein